MHAGGLHVKGLQPQGPRVHREPDLVLQSAAWAAPEGWWEAWVSPEMQDGQPVCPGWTRLGMEGPVPDWHRTC